jgi:hypothetical protein
MCQSGLMDRISVNGGTRTAVSAKLIIRANAKGMRKKTSRYSIGGKMMSHLPLRFSHSPRALPPPLPPRLRPTDSLAAASLIHGFP